jgi:predicted lipoprotein with Yx(FWY)xxD motif
VRNLATLAVGIAVLAALAGCGGSGSSTTGSTTATAAKAAATSSAYSHVAATTTPAATGVVVTAKHGKAGTILAAGPRLMTVYLFEGDKGQASSCSGTCASAWPPVTTASAPTASGTANSASLGTITRSDGTKQVSYNGHPLYFFVQDKDSGDAYGQGVKAFGADWYVVAPSGNKVDKS